jgi:hypothetical protein
MASSSKAPVHAPDQDSQEAFAYQQEYAEFLARFDADAEAILAKGYP